MTHRSLKKWHRRSWPYLRLSAVRSVVVQLARLALESTTWHWSQGWFSTTYNCLLLAASVLPTNILFTMWTIPLEKHATPDKKCSFCGHYRKVPSKINNIPDLVTVALFWYIGLYEANLNKEKNGRNDNHYIYQLIYWSRDWNFAQLCAVVHHQIFGSMSLDGMAI